jgi:hypothetical protein
MHGHWLVLTELIRVRLIGRWLPDSSSACDNAACSGMSATRRVPALSCVVTCTLCPIHRLQEADIDLEAANRAGLSVRDITQQQQQQHAAAASPGSTPHAAAAAAAPAPAAAAAAGKAACASDGDDDSLAWSGDDDAVAAAERAAEAAAQQAADEAAWREKLAYEMGYDLPAAATAAG